jgi:hypothetical protein
MTKVRNREVKPASLRQRARRAHSEGVGKILAEADDLAALDELGYPVGAGVNVKWHPVLAVALRHLKTPWRLSFSMAWDL